MRPWLAIPIVGVVAGAIAAALGARGLEIACAAAAAAAIVHALRALAGEGPAALAGACAGGLLAVVTIAEHGALSHHGLAVPWLAVGAAAWTFAELARPTATPYVALAPAIAAAIFEPAFVALPAIVGTRLVGKPSKEVLEAALRAQLGEASVLTTGESEQLPLPLKGMRGESGRVAYGKTTDSGRVARAESGRVAQRGAHPSKAHESRRRSRSGLPARWTIAVPIAGAILVVLAIVAGTARDGSFGTLANAWYGPRVRDAAPLAAITILAEALGPLLVVAAAGGLASLARAHLASLAVLACAIGAVLVDLRTGAAGASTLGLAALCAGAGIARLAGMIRLRSGQAITAGACGALLLVGPVWTMLGR